VYKRYGISTAMKPHTTIRKLLVHPKDKESKEDTAECVYRIPCKNCQKVYIGETGRSLGVRIKEHRKEVELHEGKKYTRSTRKQSQSEQNKSAITDHVNTENHIIDWEEATIITLRTPKAPGNSHSLSRTNLRSQTMSTQKITSSTGRRRQLSAGNLIGQHGGSKRLSKSDRKPKTS